MSELGAIRSFYRLNSRVRKNYLTAILALPLADRLKDRGASYPSVQEIFVHTLDGLRFWFENVPHDTIASATQLDARQMTEAELQAAVEATDQLVFGYLDTLRGANLTDELVCHFSPGDPAQETRVPVRDLLWHMIEEELQHRGELNALFWQMDIDPPIAQYEDWKAAQTEPRVRRRRHAPK